MKKSDYLSINKKLWNDKTAVHFASEFYNVNAFLEGSDSLNEPELKLLGDMQGLKILHLQCHFGMDTISLSRHGAKATGVDLSEESIGKANYLRDKVGVDTKFVRSDIYSLPEKLNEKFDLIFTSYGVLGWLPDMDKWARVIRHFLKPKGKLVLVEFHPVIWMFSYDFKQVEFNYCDSEPIVEELEGTYADRNAALRNKSVSWNHGLAKVINALIKNGFHISDFHELNYSPYDCFENTIEISQGRYQIKGLENKLPMLYSLVAEMT